MKKQTYTVIVTCNLKYNIKASSPEEAKQLVEEVELPKEYVEDSFEIVEIYDAKGFLIL